MSEYKKFSYSKISSELFSLSSEYQLYLIERIDSYYKKLNKTIIKINDTIPDGDFDLYKQCFWYVETYIDNYSKLVKSTKLSLGEKVGRVKSKQQIYNNLNYTPNIELQHNVIHGLRNTSQHFEERIQDYLNDINPFLKLSYKDVNLDWEIMFGIGGFTHSGRRKNTKYEKFNSKKSIFHSYIIENKKLKKISILLIDIWKDKNEIHKMIVKNIESKHNEINPNIPFPPRSLSLFVEPIKKKS